MTNKIITPTSGRPFPVPTTDLQTILLRDGQQIFTVTYSANLGGYIFADLNRETIGVHDHCAVIRLWERDEVGGRMRLIAAPNVLYSSGYSYACDLSLDKYVYVGYDDPTNLDHIGILGEILWTSHE